ncbi:NAD(P)-binding protein [Pholiota conissans]|uniref:NAD(P)-binding protein n=1 Tax=Pholiota conissans TaxID=109636 RepID=A0A9P5Z0V2_9AGAR|nr:NAD(P)-binding protein [Pholiota conissans]
MPSWLITGSNRGIGYGLVKNLLKKENTFVIATARNPNAPSLTELAAKYPDTLKVVEMDIISQESVDKAVEIVTPLLPNGLDYLVNNAGKNPQPNTKFEDLDLDLFAEEIAFNTTAPLRVSRAFLPLIKKSELKRIIFISSVLASSNITFMMANQFNAYSVAKAALNMLAHKWAATLKYEGVTTAAVHPGWTQTELGEGINEWMAKYAGHVRHFTPEESADNVIKVSEALTLDKTGAFWHADGTNLPW